MASDLDYIIFVTEQIRDLGYIRYMKMFGDYMIYVEEKPTLMICDDTIYIKKLEVLEGLMEDAETGKPYPGAKEHYILDPDNKELLEVVIKTALPYLQIPKSKKKKDKI